MGEHNFRLDQPFAGRKSSEDMVRQTYNHARKIDGLLGRDAFMRACHAYATSNPDVPDYLVPSHVAKILNPDLDFQKRRFLQ
jgi:hypothetical protein